MPDLKTTENQQEAIESFFLGHQVMVSKVDEMLARRRLSRIHYRILFFIRKYPELNLKKLLSYLGISKQATSQPIRQLIEMGLISSQADATDKRKRLLFLTATGDKLEQNLRREQVRVLEAAILMAGEEAMRGWLKVNQAIGKKASKYLTG